MYNYEYLVTLVVLSYDEEEREKKKNKKKKNETVNTRFVISSMTPIHRDSLFMGLSAADDG